MKVVFFGEIEGSVPVEPLSRISIHPRSKMVNILLPLGRQVGTLGKESPNEPVRIFITTTLRSAVRMGIEEEGSISFSTTGFSYTIRVSELAAVITGKGLEKRVESGAIKAFRAVRHPANACRI